MAAMIMLLLRPAFVHHGKRFVFDPFGYYTFSRISVGDYVSIGSSCVLMASESSIEIGSHVLIGPGVALIGGNHNTSVVGQFMCDVLDKRPEDDEPITIQDDVWIGTGAIILKGVTIGRGSVIAARAVVTRDVMPYTVVAGVPARVLRLRFTAAQICDHEQKLYIPSARLSPEVLSKVMAQTEQREDTCA